MADSRETTKVDQWIRFFKNHKILAVIFFLGIVFIAVGSIFDAWTKIQKAISGDPLPDRKSRPDTSVSINVGSIDNHRANTTININSPASGTSKTVNQVSPPSETYHPQQRFSPRTFYGPSNANATLAPEILRQLLNPSNLTATIQANTAGTNGNSQSKQSATQSAAENRVAEPPPSDGAILNSSRRTSSQTMGNPSLYNGEVFYADKGSQSILVFDAETSHFLRRYEYTEQLGSTQTPVAFLLCSEGKTLALFSDGSPGLIRYAFSPKTGELMPLKNENGDTPMRIRFAVCVSN